MTAATNRTGSRCADLLFRVGLASRIFVSFSSSILAFSTSSRRWATSWRFAS